jgi:hypothetical protein
MNILEKLSKLKKKHSYFYAEQHENELPFSLEIDLNDTLHQAPYDETYQPLTNINMSQRKLLLSEIQLMNEYYKIYSTTSQKTPLILYIGSAPGVHIPYLHMMYPKLKFVLYDSAKFDKTLVDYNTKLGSNIFEFHEDNDGIFTTEKANELINKYTEYDLLFICDIRLDSDNNNDFDKNVMNNIRQQEEWVRILNPLLSLLKFRLPYNVKDNITYISGKLLYGIWRPPKSTESRLLIHQNEINQNNNYNGDNYEKNLFFNSKYTRPFSFMKAFDDFPEYITNTNKYCPCFDCYAELTILKEYDSIIPLTQTSFKNMDDIINILTRWYSNKFWSLTWDENLSIENSMRQFDEEPNSILGVRRHIPTQNKNILIAIPKVNIYKLENFESLFVDYISGFYESIKQINIPNMCNYSIIILDSLPFKEHIYYGALLNSVYSIAKFSEYDTILFHEPFLRPNKKMLELYLSGSIEDDIILYSNIYSDSVSPLSVFAIKKDVFNFTNGFPNNIWDVLMSYNICLERMKRTNFSINYVINNEIDSNSIYFNISYTDDIADVRPSKLAIEMSNDEINNLNIIREKSNYDNWCGLKQKYFFHTEQIRYYSDNTGNIPEIKVYNISLHNSCTLYNEIDLYGTKIESIDDINRLLIEFIKMRKGIYMIDEKLNIIDENKIEIEYVTNDTFLGINMNYGEFIECILNILEDLFLYIRLLRTDDENIEKILNLMINKWYVYISVIITNEPKKMIIELSNPERLIDSELSYSSLTKLRKIYEYSQVELDKYVMRSLYYDYDEYMKDIVKFMLHYNKYTYLNLLVHNLNVFKVMKNINDFEETII